MWCSHSLMFIYISYHFLLKGLNRDQTHKFSDYIGTFRARIEPCLLYDTSPTELNEISTRSTIRGLWYLMPLSTILLLYRGRKFYWCRKLEKTTDVFKSLTNFITWCCIEYTLPWAGLELAEYLNLWHMNG